MIYRAVFCSAVVAMMIVTVPGQYDASDVRKPHAVDAKQSLATSLQVPVDVQQTMNKACNNCHSYSTEWPWYSRLVPLKWLIESDVERARAAFNSSEWTTTAGRRKGTALGVLAAVCEDARTRRMPPTQYRIIHTEANLSDAEVSTLCSWSRTAMKQVKESPDGKRGGIVNASVSR